ncbi:hypothetical protein H0H87_003188 [Tephrocybe sp. NHM501043]|nr:hypothetical protein H0H87_003188 [Tephrocybe sp. NHM501043]
MDLPAPAWRVKNSARSPSRSPRLTGLLDALKDVIGEEPDEEYNSEEATYVEEPLKGGNTCTVIDTSRSLPTESSGSSNYEEDDILRLKPQSTIQTAGTSPSPPSTSHLISPVDLHLGSFSPNDPVDTLVSPLKSTFGVLSSPFATASSRVLSPRLSAFISRSHSSSYTPPPVVEDDNNVHFDMSLDSPSDHAFNQPQPEPSEEYIVTEELDRSPLFPCAPPPAVRDDGGVPSDASLEAPFDHALDTVELEPSEEYPVAEEPAVEGNTLEHDKDSEGDGNVEASSVVARECDVESTSVHVDTAEFDENEAIANSSMHHPFLSSRLNCGEVTAVSPHDLSAPDAMYGLGSDPPVDSLSDTSRLAPEDHAESDNTAELAYLHSPTVEVNENDTIHSLIEQYCSDAESSSNSTESPLVKDNESPVMESPLVTPLDDILLDTAEIESPSGTTPVRSTFIRERVFTPPPIMSVARGRSGTVTASDSPRSNSPPPPIPFSRPPFQPSPGSAWSPDSAVFEVQEAVVSKKVAFGFRKPLVCINIVLT